MLSHARAGDKNLKAPRACNRMLLDAAVQKRLDLLGKRVDKSGAHSATTIWHCRLILTLAMIVRAAREEWPNCGRRRDTHCSQ
jgi:hypothetical protein